MSKLAAVDHIDPSPWADLFEHPADHIERLAEDIAERGIQTPLHVYPRGERYELLAGHDRLEAAKRLELDDVPIEVRSMLSDEDERFAYFLKDNTLRKTVNAGRIAEAAIRRHPDWSTHRLASFAGVSVSTVHAAKERLESVAPQLFGPNTTGKDGREQPAHKPRLEPKPQSKLEQLRQQRERTAPDTAAFPFEPSEEVSPSPVPSWEEPATNGEARTCRSCGATLARTDADGGPCIACRTAENKAQARARVPDRPVYTHRMQELITAAVNAADASAQEITAVPTNDVMIQSVLRTIDLLERIVAHHKSKGRQHGNSA